jgi:uncharacterized protein
MSLAGKALRMTVIISQDDRFHHRPLYTEIVHRAHQAGLAGATVVRGCEGFGATSHIHTARLLSLTEGLPAVIIIVDTQERIRAFLPEIQSLVVAGLVMLDEVEVVTYARRPEPESATT